MQFKKTKFLTMTIGSLGASLALADQASSNGFLEDSHLNLLLRNFYIDQDNHDGGNDRRDWAQGFMLDYKSGYTQGTVGFGIDLHGYAGVKLDSNKGEGRSQLLPPEHDGSTSDSTGMLGGAVKMRISNTELKYGNLRPYNPVFALADTRLLPATATGFMLNSAELPGLSLDAGHFTASKDMNRSNSRGDFLAIYAGVASDTVDYVGGKYSVNDQLKLSLYASKYADVWKQYYGNVNYTLPVNEKQKLNLDFNIYRTNDEGKALAGKIDNTAWSLGAAYTVAAHTFGLSYQEIDGDQPFDYLGLSGGAYQDSIYLGNSSQYADFNGPHERSWQARYTLDMATLGVPGLSFMARYTRGDNIDGSHMDASSPYAYYGSDEKHWERDFDVRYVVQSGPAKNLSMRVRQATHRMSGVSDSDVDQLRLIVEYPISFF